MKLKKTDTTGSLAGPIETEITKKKLKGMISLVGCVVCKLSFNRMEFY